MIKIGTRDSKLAVFQATLVQSRLKNIGIAAELVFIKTIGDRDQETPLGAFKNPGIFANEINQQVISGTIDLAVHSCKDLPSQLDDELDLTTVLERAETHDVLVFKPSFKQKLESGEHLVIATSSERRKFQWLAKYVNSQMVELRGNIPTRLEKLYSSQWDGAIFAQAALSRLNIKPEHTLSLSEFIPAAAQGSIAIVSHSKNMILHKQLNKINHASTYITTQVEREILRTLKIGCSTPFGCIAVIEPNGSLTIKAQLFNVNGTQVINAQTNGLAFKRDQLITQLLTDLKQQGAIEFLHEIKNAKSA